MEWLQKYATGKMKRKQKLERHSVECIRVHISAKAADLAKLSLLNK